MPALDNEFELEHCPHCRVARPHLIHLSTAQTNTHSGTRPRWWKFYRCVTCGGVVTAWSDSDKGQARQWFPQDEPIDESIPPLAREYLRQCRDSQHAPAGAVMLAASAVDAMLKTKQYVDGTLNSRIEEAARNHLITKEMAEWAHRVRLDANDQRHADKETSIPSESDAKRSLEFATALGEFLFVLPARVRIGISGAHEEQADPAKGRDDQA